MEELKNTLETQNKQLKHELKLSKDQETEMNRKYEALKKRSENESQNLNTQRENEKLINQ